MMRLSRFLRRVAPLAVALLLSGGCASILVSLGIGYTRTPAGMVREEVINKNRWRRLVPGIIDWSDSLEAAGILRDTFVTGRGDCRLHAMYIAARQPVPRTAVVVHGYTASPYNVMMLVRMYRDSLGFNVLAPSLRHHYLSGGDYVQMGWNDRLDLLQWSGIAHDIFNDTLQLFHGVSMGAATVMMASGEDTPAYVRGFIEDCGYSDVWNEFSHISRKYFHKDTTFTANVERIAERRFGLDFHEASSCVQLAKCDKPMLFIHGDSDGLVPVEMAYRNYEAKTRGYKELWITNGSAHSDSYPDNPAGYTAKVREFVEGHILNTVAE